MRLYNSCVGVERENWQKIAWNCVMSKIGFNKNTCINKRERRINLMPFKCGAMAFVVVVVAVAVCLFIYLFDMCNMHSNVLCRTSIANLFIVSSSSSCVRFQLIEYFFVLFYFFGRRLLLL